MMEINKKWRKILFIGFMAKLVITILVFGILFKLNKDFESLSSSHLIGLSRLENSIKTLEGKAIKTPSEPVIQTNNSTELLSKINLLKLIHTLKESIQSGDNLDFSSIKHVLTNDELDMLYKEQEKITGKDETLIQEISLCLKYVSTNASEEKQPEKAIIENFIDAEPLQTYDNKLLITTLLSNTQKALVGHHYDMALNYLNDCPNNTYINNCLQGVKDSIQARATLNNILLSLEQRILNDK